MSSFTPGFINSIRHAMDSYLDPSLVENTPRLLDVLNRSDRLQRLLMRRDSRGYTLLHLAAERNQPESLKCLLIKEASPNVTSTGVTNEVTPIHVAAGLGHLACLQLLVQSGGDVLAMDNRQKTPLDYASLNGQDLCLNYLHNEVARRQTMEAQEIEDVLTEVEKNLSCNNIGTLTHWQLFNDLFPLNVSAGSNLSPTESLLYRRCEVNNSQELVRVFSRLSKDIPLRLHDASLLHAAARYGRIELVRLLTERVPQVALSVSSEGYNALHVAIVHHQAEVAKLLIEKQIKWTRKTRHLTISGSGSNVTTAPIEGSGLENSLSHGAARFATPTMSGHTVLHFAVAVNNVDSLFYLLKYHRELQLTVDCRDCGYTSLHLAVFLNKLDPIKLLLNKGANPNSKIDPSMADSISICRTPLAEAALNKNPQVVNYLLDHGAEDRQHYAIKKCVPYHLNSDLVVLLLASLIKHDDTIKPLKPSLTKDHRRHKFASLEWANLSLTKILPGWIAGSLTKVTFLRSIELPRVLEYVTFVNLSNNQLQSLPVELFHLPKMSVLNLTSNQLECLPELNQVYCSGDETYRWPCHALSKVYLNKNVLRSLPEFLFQLPNLVHLDLSFNQLKELSFDLWKAPKLHTLHCTNNEIEAIPTNWPHVLSSCTVIDSTSIPPKSTMEAPQLKKRKSMSKLDTKSHDSPGPTSLEKADSEEQESSNAPLISKLHDCLNVSNSLLPVDWDGAEGRDEIYDGLAILNLSNNSITEIPENFPCLCPKLIRLDLSHNKISSISLPHSFPPELKQINLSFNEIESIICPESMAKPLPCTNPGALLEANYTIYMDNVSFCSHRSHVHMVKLGVLEITDCCLQDINFYCPGPRNKQNEDTKKPQYKVETMTSTASPALPKQDSITPSRLVCPFLTRLILSRNQLIKVPESVCKMTSLNSLDLSHNDIIDLPAVMGNLSNLWEFPLAGLKLISPPQNIIERGKTKDIIGFLWSLLQRARPYHRMKLMLVGKANRGKTTLLAKISEKGQRGIKDNWGSSRINASLGNIATVGIVVSDWTYFKKVKESQTALKSITFMTWDFGGQEEYYATHQCFLSRRSLYLAVWNITDGIRGVEELKPWLLNIQARAPHSPVIIVGTHQDKLKLGRTHKQEHVRCLDSIDQNYGSCNARKEGFPQIMASVVVSCSSGKGINTLRDIIFDVASQVRENTVAGRGIGCGRISEYRLLMDQLVPASYLQLEDTVRNIALNMRLAGNPPVLNYKRLRNEVFSDSRTLISKNSGNRELEQAVRFLHDNGTMLHYEDPLLSDFYFVDPQWLCDMLAHIVTVREINPLVKDGIMHISDFPLIFNDMEFPIRWQAEYIRLLTTFEVAVELGQGQLLIPSALPQMKPNLPQSRMPEEVRQLPPIYYTYIVPFVPSGFWPRLMSRLVTDSSLLKLAREGCGISEDEDDQLNWLKWRTGMILQYGNLTLLSIEELNGGMFTETQEDKGIVVFADEQWQHHSSTSKIFGVKILSHDIYPILKFPEAMKKYKRINPGYGPGASRGRAGRAGSGSNSLPRTTVDIFVASEEGAQSGEKVSTSNKVVSIDQIDLEFEKLRNRRGDGGRGSSSTSSNASQAEGGGGMGVVSDNSNGRVSPSPPVGAGRKKPNFAKSLDRMSSLPSPNSSSKPPSPLPHLPQSLLDSIQQNYSPSSPGTAHSTSPISVTEADNDRMRAGLISKAVDHITLLIEDWFMGVRPKTLVVPCPHCSASATPPIKMERSFSEVLELLPQAEREEKQRMEGGVVESAPRGSDVLLSGVEHHGNKHPQDTFKESVHSFKYAYRYNDCVVAARKYSTMFCPSHGEIPIQYLAPDTLFLTEGKEVLIDSNDLERGESIGRGAFATVYRASYKNGQEVALKSMTKEWDSRGNQQEEPPLEAEDGRGREEHARNARPRPPSRHSIVTGFTNVRKELSILSPLHHPHVVRLFGVMLRPMGLVLELAPMGSLKKILSNHLEVHAKLHVRGMQRVLLQVASAIDYLHQCNIIYRDLKSDNVLVWKFPEPRDPVLIPLGSDLGSNAVQVKLSDYGISQFVATQGARGMVGTPGFMAPEILKYHGKEVYNQEVDIFSFGMFIYELLTQHLPYEALAIQQANQANERGTRPSLSKRDYPCPMLVRELMVWSWQQAPDDRPVAKDIIRVANEEQFPRLLDGIRICNSGQVTATCMRIASVSQSNYIQRRESRLISPPPAPLLSSLNLSSTDIPLPTLQVVSEEEMRGKEAIKEGQGSLGGQGASSGGQGGSSGGQRRLSGGRRGSLGGQGLSSGSQRGLSGGQELCSSIEKRDSEGRRYSDCGGHICSDYGGHRHSDSGGHGYSDSGGRRPSLLSSPLVQSQQQQHPSSSEDLRIKGASPYYLPEEEISTCEVWVSSSNARHSTISVIDYNLRFSNIEDVEVGDSPVLSLCLVLSKVWIGMEIGCLLVYDANTRKPYLQTWVKPYKKLQTMVYISSIHRVYIGLDDGTILAFQDQLPATPLMTIDPSITNPPLVSLMPIAQYRDSAQSSACMLALHSNTAIATTTDTGSNQSDVSQRPASSGNPNNDTHPSTTEQSGKGCYELWVGQKAGMITVLDAESLKVIKFMDNPLDHSVMPSYVAHLSYSHLVCGYDLGNGASSKGEGHGGVASSSDNVYSALYHGQYVTKWNPVTKEAIESFDSKLHGGGDPGCSITALLYSHKELYVGLSSGLILILDPSSFLLLSSLSSHRGQISSFLLLNLSTLHHPHHHHPHHPHSSQAPPTGYTSSSSSSNNPSPINIASPASSSTSVSSPPVSMDTSYGCGQRLLSFGSGFKSYFDGPESKQHLKAGFLLVWDSDFWRTHAGPDS